MIHETHVRQRPASGPDDIGLHQAVCTCGWHWAYRLYADHAQRDANAHHARTSGLTPTRRAAPRGGTYTPPGGSQ